MNTKNIRSYDYRIDPQDIDHTKCAKIVAAGGYILDAAGEDAFNYGIGVAQLNEYNASWVLLRWNLEFSRLPNEYERVKVRTWVSDINRLMTTRNLIMTGEDGGVIGMAITNWAVIDLSTRRSKDLNAFSEYRVMLQDIPAPMELPLKLPPMTDGRLVKKHRVVYSDIDFNKHTNTMSYLKWALDTYPLERFEEGGLGKIEMNFIHESRHGELLSIYAGHDEETDKFEIRNEEDAVVCRISIGRR